MDRSLACIALVAAIALGGASAALGQAYPSSQFANEPFKPYTPRRSGPPPPRFGIEPARDEIPFPGPIGGRAPRIDGEAWVLGTVKTMITVKVDSGDVETEAGSIPEDTGTLWAIGGRRDNRRFSVLPEGMVVAQKKCRRCEAGWKKSWKLRMGASTPAAPVTLGNRVFVGSVDNRVYGLKAKNGHRVWVADAGGRMLQSPTVWTGTLDGAEPGAEPFSILLVIPDGDPRLLVLDPYDGKKLAEASFRGSAALTRPVVTADGRILVGRQGYDPSDAALVVLSVVPKATDDPDTETDAAAEPSDGPMNYNDATPAPASPTDRPAVVARAP